MRFSTKIPALTCLTIMLFSLSGCVNREQADAKLTEACTAVIRALLYDNQSIDSIKSATHSPSTVGSDYRHVQIVGVMKDGWLEAESQYDCIFQESFGMFKNNYTASIYQVQMEDRTIGKAGDEILGSTDEFVKIEEAIREVLYK